MLLLNGEKYVSRNDESAAAQSEALTSSLSQAIAISGQIARKEPPTAVVMRCASRNH